MLDWLKAPLAQKLPIGEQIEQATDFVTTHFAGTFDAISATLGRLIDGLTDALLWVDPFVFIAAFALIGAVLRRNISVPVMIVLGLLLIWNLGYWEATVETLALVLCATGLCLLIGVPLGIMAAHRPWLYTLLRPVLDLMQTIPPFVYLIPTLILFGLGVVPGLISTAVFAVAAPIRLTHLGITSVPKQLLEAGEAFGATPMQRLWKIELPHAMPSIMAGITQCIMLSLSMVVIAALVGAGGLGKPVVRALNSVNIAQGFEAGLCIVIVAILLDRLFRYRAPQDIAASANT